MPYLGSSGVRNGVRIEVTKKHVNTEISANLIFDITPHLWYIKNTKGATRTATVSPHL